MSMGNATITAVHFRAADLYSGPFTSTGFFTGSLGLPVGFQAPTSGACGETVAAAGASVAVVWAGCVFASPLTSAFLAAGVVFVKGVGVGLVAWIVGVGLAAWIVGVGLEAWIVGVGLVAVNVGVGLVAGTGGAGNSTFFFWGFAVVDARGLVLRAGFAVFAVFSPADDAVFWTRGFAAVAAFRRKAGVLVRQLPRRPIARALGHRADILRWVWVRSLGKEQVVLVCRMSRNKEPLVVVQPAGSRSIENLSSNAT